MKYIYTLLLFTISLSGSAQFYSVVNIQTYRSDNIASGIGGEMSFGHIAKRFYYGGGTGLTFFDSNQPYIPVFAEVGINSGWILSLQAGYGFYNGPGSITGKEVSVKGSYTEQLKAGFYISLHDRKSLQVFTAITHRNFRADGNSIDKLYYGFGLGIRFK